MQLHCVHPGLASPHGGGGELVGHGGDVVVIHDPVVGVGGGRHERLGHHGALVGGHHPVQRVDRHRPRFRRYPHGATGHGVLKAHLPCVGELHGDLAPVGVDPVGSPPPRRDELVVGDGRLALVGAAHRMGDTHRPQHDHGHPALGPGFEIGGLVVRHLAVLVAQLLAHGGHDQPVAQLQGADPAWRQQMLVTHGPIMAHRRVAGQNAAAPSGP